MEAHHFTNQPGGQPGQVEEASDQEDNTENIINKANQFVFYYMGQWFSIAFNFTLAVSALELYYTVTQLKKAFSLPNSEKTFQKNANTILEYLMPAVTTGTGVENELTHDISNTGKWLLRGGFSFIFVAARIDRVFLPMQFLGKMIREGNDLSKFAIVPLTTRLSKEEARDQCDEVRLSICFGLFSKICGLIGACMVFNRAPSMHALFLDASFYLTMQQIFDSAGTIAESLPGLAGVKQTLVLKSNQRGVSSRGRGILVTILTFASIFFTWLMENPKHTRAQRRKVMFYTSVVPTLVSLGIYGFHHVSEYLIKQSRSFFLKADSEIKKAGSMIKSAKETLGESEDETEKEVDGSGVVDNQVDNDQVDNDQVDHDQVVYDDVVSDPERKKDNY